MRANFQKQRNLTKYKPQERQIIKLLKLYMVLNKLNISGVAIEQMTISAMSDRNFGAAHSIADNMLNVMDYISRRVMRNRLNEVSNSNNNLFEGVTWWKNKI